MERKKQIYGCIGLLAVFLAGCTRLHYYVAPSQFTATYGSISRCSAPVPVTLVVEVYGINGKRLNIDEDAFRNQVLDVFEATGAFVDAGDKGDEYPTFKVVLRDVTDLNGHRKWAFAREITSLSNGLISSELDFKAEADISLNGPNGVVTQSTIPYQVPIRYGRHTPPSNCIDLGSNTEAQLESLEHVVLEFIHTYQHQTGVTPASADVTTPSKSVTPAYFSGVVNQPSS